MGVGVGVMVGVCVTVEVAVEVADRDGVGVYVLEGVGERVGAFA